MSALTATGQILGTLGCMAPEQVEGRAVDHRAGLFAFGCVLYELATGNKAFTGATPFEVARRTVADHPPPPAAVNPHVPAGLSGFVMSLLAKDPADRPPTAGVVRDTLREIDVAFRGRSDPGLSASSPGFGGLRPLPRRRPLWWILFLVVSGTAAALAGWWRAF